MKKKCLIYNKSLKQKHHCETELAFYLSYFLLVNFNSLKMLLIKDKNRFEIKMRLFTQSLQYN